MVYITKITSSIINWLNNTIFVMDVEFANSDLLEEAKEKGFDITAFVSKNNVKVLIKR